MLKINGDDVQISGTTETCITDLKKAVIIIKMLLLKFFSPEMTEKIIEKTVNNALKLKENEDYFSEDQGIEEND